MENESELIKWTNKEKSLEKIIHEAAIRSSMIFVGFSGGVDSSYLLLKTAACAGTERVTAVTVVGPTCAQEDAQELADFAHKLGITHVVLEAPEFQNPLFLENDPSRCYHCKLSRYQAILRLTDNPSENSVFDGSQADDELEDRPGARAINELGIFTPLATAGINKKEICDALIRLGFSELAAKRAEPCLATRIPFGRPIVESELKTVKMGEDFLRNHGVRTCRLRHHGNLARIVTDKAGLKLMTDDESLKTQVVILLKSLGFKHVTLDLQEYGSGS